MVQLLFQTQRLQVRRLASDDLDALYAVYSDAEAMRWVDDGQPISWADCVRWLEVTHRNYATYGYGMSALVLRATDAVIGFCGLVHPGGQVEAEIKYALLQPYWGQGLAGEGLEGLAQAAAQVGHGRLPAHRRITRAGRGEGRHGGGEGCGAG